MKERISKNRKLFGNPYAFLNGDGELDAALLETENPATIEISQERQLLQNPYAYLDGEGEFYLEKSITESQNNKEFRLNVEAIKKLKVARKRGKFSYSDIEKIVISLQREIWTNRSLIIQGAEDIDQ